MCQKYFAQKSDHLATQIASLIKKRNLYPFSSQSVHTQTDRRTATKVLSLRKAGDNYKNLLQHIVGQKTWCIVTLVLFGWKLVFSKSLECLLSGIQSSILFRSHYFSVSSTGTKCELPTVITQVWLYEQSLHLR